MAVSISSHRGTETMSVLQKLLFRRRWILWVPVVVSALVSRGDPAEFGMLLVGGIYFWIPYWLAWWLSDGFKGLSTWPGAGAPNVSAGINPATGKPCMVHHLPWGKTYMGGN